MNLHVIPASVFVIKAIKIFEEAFPKKNYFIITGASRNFQSEIRKYLDEKWLKFIDEEERWWKKGFINYSKYTSFYVHNLYSLENIFYTNCAPRELRILGIIWGHEFYGIKEFWKKQTFGEKTKGLNLDKLSAPKNKSLSSKLIYKASRVAKLLTSRKYRALNPSIKSRKNAFKKLSYVLTHVKPDYDNIISSLDLKAKWGHFSYYSYEDYGLNSSIFQNKKILLGNSATKTNNHLEAIDVLADQKINYEVICPLNYGDQKYAEEIIKYGKKKLGDLFLPLTNFLPLQEYNKLQKECGLVIMNHYRQQGAGNIIAAILYGSKVFMSNSSPLFSHFKSLGIAIYSMEQDFYADNLNLLGEQGANKNRDIIFKNYSFERQKLELTKIGLI